MSCMSVKGVTWTSSSTVAQAVRNSLRVSGPKVENISTPCGRNTRRISPNRRTGSASHWNVRLEKARSTLASASGRRVTSAQAASGRRPRRRPACARRTMAGAKSMPSTRARRYMRCNACVA